MTLAETRIRKIFPRFNEEPITEEDFWRVCKKEKIVVREMPLEVSGYYEYRKGRHYILIDCRLQGAEWLRTALHEFYHYLFDAPRVSDSGTIFSKKQCLERDPRELRAEAFALVCLIPFPDLVKIAAMPPIDDPALLQMAGERVLVRTRFGW